MIRAWWGASDSPTTPSDGADPRHPSETTTPGSPDADTSDSLRRSRYPALATVSRAVSQAAAGADWRAHHAPADRAAPVWPGNHRPHRRLQRGASLPGGRAAAPVEDRATSDGVG